jgi:superoxide dismutase, Fe-Mn family
MCHSYHDNTVLLYQAHDDYPLWYTIVALVFSIHTLFFNFLNMQYTPKKFSLPDIKGLSKELIELHIGLYQGYVTHVNLLTTQMNTLAESGDTFMYTISELRRRLGFEWNGMRLHEYYFTSLEKGPKVLLADSKLYEALAKQYGSFSAWLEIFTKFSARGPGWALLTYDKESDHFFHVWVADHEIGHLATLPIILAVDHWEHAYLTNYTPKEKPEYVGAYLKALNWETVNDHFLKAIS